MRSSGITTAAIKCVETRTLGEIELRTLVLGLVIAALTVAAAAGTAHAGVPLEQSQTCQQLGACQVLGQAGLTYTVDFDDAGDPTRVDIVNAQCAPATQGNQSVVVCLATPMTRPNHP